MFDVFLLCASYFTPNLSTGFKSELRLSHSITTPFSLFEPFLVASPNVYTTSVKLQTAFHCL